MYINMFNESRSSFNFNHSSRNSSDLVERDHELIESYSVAIKVIFICIACVSVLSSLTAVIIMHQSKKIPYASKFMSTGLLTFDVLFTVLSTVRKFVVNPIISLHIQTIVLSNVQLSVFTVGLMSLERYFLICKPMWYITTVDEQFIRKTTLLMWLCEGIIFLFVRYGVCYFRFQTMFVYTTTGFCNILLTTYYAIFIGTVLVTSSVCYWNIFKCIQSKQRAANTLSISSTTENIRSYRSTYLVFVYLLIIIFTSAAYAVVIILTRLGILQPITVRPAIEIVSIFNCILDPFIYVLWFKECRLHLVKFLGIFFKKCEDKAEKMRIEIFDIVTVGSNISDVSKLPRTKIK